MNGIASDHLHAYEMTMDLLKWALKLGPLVPGELLLDCFELARDARTLDMRASPYDVSGYGLDAVRVETAVGRATYVGEQRCLAARAAPLRERLLGVCRAARVVLAQRSSLTDAPTQVDLVPDVPAGTGAPVPTVWQVRTGTSAPGDP